MEWWKLVIGFVIAFGIGVACRAFGLPVPAPPTLYGALLIVAITLGFATANHFLPKPSAAAAPGAQQEL